MAQAYDSQSFLLKLKTITGARLRSMIILTILKTLVSAAERENFNHGNQEHEITFETTTTSSFVTFRCITDVA